MSQRKFTLLLSIILLNLVLCVNVNTAAQNYVPRNVDIDRLDLPKNILVGCYVGGRSHLKPMLDVATILAERGYNVKKKNFLKQISAYFLDWFLISSNMFSILDT